LTGTESGCIASEIPSTHCRNLVGAAQRRATAGNRARRQATAAISPHIAADSRHQGYPITGPRGLARCPSRHPERAHARELPKPPAHRDTRATPRIRNACFFRRSSRKGP